MAIKIRLTPFIKYEGQEWKTGKNHFLHARSRKLRTHFFLCFITFQLQSYSTGKRWRSLAFRVRLESVYKVQWRGKLQIYVGKFKGLIKLAGLFIVGLLIKLVLS